MVEHRSSIAVEPGGTRRWLEGAVEGGGGTVVPPADAGALVWGHHAAPERLEALLVDHPQLAWVQLPWAGVEPYVDLIRRFADRQWTCGKGVYAEPVAEHALALALTGLRHLHTYAAAATWTEGAGRNLLGAKVVVVGGGGITASFLRLLGPFGCDVTVVRRTPGDMAGASAVVGLDQLDGALQGAQLLVLAVALTPETTGLVDRRRLELLAPGAWLVNVARGPHVVTDDLVAVLAEGRLGGAGLDVTDPEPLPDGHPLWSEPRCVITPHTANTVAMAGPLLRARVGENVRRWIAGEDLLGDVDVEAGY
ncbi:MAG: NAD(P)-dependent oxidoreductase [Acidimicrobiales bacterium]|nr:NAD(P)-dependent oxidoreductase [Acidimicrobiales bacterium]